MTTRTGYCVIGLLVIAGLGIWQMLTGPTIIRQNRNMTVATEFLPSIRQKLESSGAFAQIQVSEFTGAGGSLLVRGEVASERDVQQVRRLVEETRPPVSVVYQVFATNEVK